MPAYLKRSGCRDWIIPSNNIYNSTTLSEIFVAFVSISIISDTFPAGITITALIKIQKCMKFDTTVIIVLKY